VREESEGKGVRNVAEHSESANLPTSLTTLTFHFHFSIFIMARDSASIKEHCHAARRGLTNSAYETRSPSDDAPAAPPPAATEAVPPPPPVAAVEIGAPADEGRKMWEWDGGIGGASE
jgi:hypothetical protein